MINQSEHPRSLVVGASGQVGKQIIRAAGMDHCIPTVRNPPFPEWLTLDLALIDREVAMKLLEPLDLNAIYCVGGMTNVELCEAEKDLVIRANCSGPKALAEVANERHIPFVYFSTEYIFDGVNGPYYEESAANPLSYYGLSKWRGEQAVLNVCPHALIVRTTVVYGSDDAEKNFLYSLKRALTAGARFQVPEDQISTPTYNRDLANATLSLVKSRATGVFHVCGPEVLNRLQFARQVAQFWGFDTDLISGVPTSSLNQRAPRPLKAGLLIKKLQDIYPAIRMRNVADSLLDWSKQ
jgi:dTDP-4-dehydrorhamnose reductase